MKITHKEQLYIKPDNLTDKLFDNSTLLFDIETTGFSPVSSNVYMIGCAYKKGKNVCIDQFFSESLSDEFQILSDFADLLKNFNTIISFNGMGFDIPFLTSKYNKYKIDENFSAYRQIDIFKQILPLKPILKLENYKQKTIEKFLGLQREDKYSGGDLINIYRNYLNNHDVSLSDLLHLHNYEDVSGMIELLPILSYNELFNGNYTIDEARISSYRTIYSDIGNELLISISNNYVIPTPISIHDDNFYISISKEKTKIRTKIINDNLKFFYPNYKDYYYLPSEDMAIHKSVAAFVDKNNKEKCKASNCYIKKAGQYLIQFDDIISPQFHMDNKEKFSFFQLTDDFCNSNEKLYRYSYHILKHFITK